jgi:hypothetical protein
MFQPIHADQSYPTRGSVRGRISRKWGSVGAGLCKKYAA